MLISDVSTVVETRGKRKAEASSELSKQPPAKKASKAAKVPTKTAPPAAKKEEKSKTVKKVPTVGDVINLEGFGGEVKNQDDVAITLKALVDASPKGVVLFTYPKASTPGCTRQACLFRDKKDALVTKSGLAVYGLSADSPKSNTTFKTKQSLNYDLICDPKQTLIGAIGLAEAGKTKRGVFVVDKSGKVLLLKKGGPEETVRWTEELEV
jgi:thioredoxin-dependent peroxiredoxin